MVSCNQNWIYGMRKINTNTNDIKFPDSMTKTATGVASL
jgi:hypothetical protein